jgi:hypothetical protein
MGFFKGLFSDSSSASFCRFATWVALLFGCVWVSFIVWHLKTSLPALDGLIAFILAPYSVGKVNETIQKYNAGQAPNGQPPAKE